MEIKAELIFPAELKNEALICNLCKQFDIIVNIVEASFSTNTGWAILIFKGSEGELKKSLAYLKDKGVKFEDIETTP
jgi:ABC-type methionine transport system ATPase subunit